MVFFELPLHAGYLPSDAAEPFSPAPPFSVLCEPDPGVQHKELQASGRAPPRTDAAQDKTLPMETSGRSRMQGDVISLTLFLAAHAGLAPSFSQRWWLPSGDFLHIPLAGFR